MKRLSQPTAGSEPAPTTPCFYDLAAQTVPKEARLFLLAQSIATETPGFFDIKGAGVGDKASNAFMTRLRRAATELFGYDYSEKRVCGQARFALDFYFPDEETAVEVALSLRNSSSEYERDIFKCLLAMDEGCPVRHLVFITKTGGHFRQHRPGPMAIRRLMSKCGLEIEIRELNDGWSDPKAAVEFVAGHQLRGTLDEGKQLLSAGRLCSIASAAVNSTN